MTCGMSRQPIWEPKHKIFLSHSGAQKAFTEHLCEALERAHHFPFFDRRDDSLRNGEEFYIPLMKAAKECRVAVLVLTREFFENTTWPMMELNEFVKAQKSTNTRLKILPLFLGITKEQLGEKERQECWLTAWKGMREDRIDLVEWQHALSEIPGNNGIEYGGQNEGEPEFIKKVVAIVCGLLPSDVQWDVSHVQSKDSMCKVRIEPSLCCSKSFRI